MLKVGITGNIGSGKTTVCRIFELLEVEVYYADNRAKEIMHNHDVKKEIKELFGPAVFNENGDLNTKRLARIVFCDKMALQNLNEIIHPQIDKDFDLWLNKRKSHAYVLKEAAILYETGRYKKLDKIIVIASSIDMMIERVRKRDNATIESVKARLSNQLDQQIKISKADYVIDNYENTLLIPQVIDVHNKLLKTSK